jgi:hypothetical protein
MSYDLLYHQKRAIKQNFKETVPLSLEHGRVERKEKNFIRMWGVSDVFPEILYTKNTSLWKRKIECNGLRVPKQKAKRQSARKLSVYIILFMKSFL